jgi:hypothetical protein
MVSGKWEAGMTMGIRNDLRTLTFIIGLATLTGLAACSDDSPTEPVPAVAWTGDGFTWTDPYGPDGDHFSRIEFRKVGATVHLRGWADAGTTRLSAGHVIGALPAEYSPGGAEAVFLLCATLGWPEGQADAHVGTAGVMIGGDGTVTVTTVQQYDGELRYLFFDSQSFSTPGDSWTNEGIAWSAPYADGGSYPSTLSYIAADGMVRLQGAANAGATLVQSGQVIGTLPEGARPPAGTSSILLCPTWGWPDGFQGGYVGTAGVIIGSDGRIEVQTAQQHDGQMQFIMFDGIGFATAATGWSGDGIVYTAPYAADGDYPSTLEFRAQGDLVSLKGLANAGGTRVQSMQEFCLLPADVRLQHGSERVVLCPTWGWPNEAPGGYVGTAGVAISVGGLVRIATVQQFDAQLQFVSFDGKVYSIED